jgi:hypothetical protein
VTSAAFNQGVMPSHMGEPMYLHNGYERVGEAKVPDDGDVKGFKQRVLVYKSAGGNAAAP